MIKLKSIITEINLFDQQPLVDELNKLLISKGASKNTHPEIVDWFLKQYTKWYIGSSDDNEKSQNVSKHNFKSGEPDWIKNTFDFKKLNDDQINELNHIIDFFYQLKDHDRKKIYKIPFPIVRKLIDRWDEQMRKKSKKQ